MKSKNLDRSEICVIAIGYSPSMLEAKSEIGYYSKILGELTDRPKFIYWDNKAWMDNAIFDRVHYVPSSEGNIGFGAAVNSARSLTDAKRLLLLNLDIEIDPKSFSELLDRIVSLEENQIWAPQLLNEDLTPQTWPRSLHTKSFAEELSSMFGYPIVEKRKLESERLFYLRGAVFSVSTKIFDQVGGFDPEFFLFGEEADFCYKCSEYTTLTLDSSIQIVHRGSQGNRSKSMFAFRHSLRARFLLQKRYNSNVSAYSLAPFIFIAFTVELLKRLTIRKLRRRTDATSNT